MAPSAARNLAGRNRHRFFHAANALTTIALIGTGFLITYPDLRAQFVGGYAMQLAEWHRWTAVAFMAMPIAWAVKTPAGLMNTVRWHFRTRWLGHWRRIHYGISLVAAAILVVTGAVLWVDPDTMSRTVLDGTITAHVGATWVVLLMLPAHVLIAGFRIVRAKLN